MPNTRDAETPAYRRFLVVGENGAGKSALIWSLPGKKFGYIFDPNALATLRGLDMDYEAFMPDIDEVQMGLPGFNQGAKKDKIGKVQGPTAYNDWAEHYNKHGEEFFTTGKYDWLVIDSLTFLAQGALKRQMFLNGRQGEVEDRGDYRVVGNTLQSTFQAMAALPINIYMTGHLQTFQDEKTQVIETLLQAPGAARNIIPLVFSEILLAEASVSKDGKPQYTVRTTPPQRGFKRIRTSMRGLEPVEDVTIPRFDATAANYGIGKLLKKAQ